MNSPTLIVDSNLSLAWGRAFLHVFDHSEPGCLIITVRNFEGDLPSQDQDIASFLNKKLRENDPLIPTIDQTALTIVPYQRWLRLNRCAHSELRNWYLENYLPRLKARCSKNRRGTYFERLVRYTGIKVKDGKAEQKEVDQLAHVLDIWRKGEERGTRPRQSALQLACFDPAKDHTGAVLSGFPCLQQISLTYKEAETLELNAYYPTQYMFDRAYGNYLGLCQLGHLIAHQLGVRFTAFNCFVPHPEIGSATKSDLADLASLLRDKVKKLEKQTPEVAQDHKP